MVSIKFFVVLAAALLQANAAPQVQPAQPGAVAPPARPQLMSTLFGMPGAIMGAAASMPGHFQSGQIGQGFMAIPTALMNGGQQMMSSAMNMPNRFTTMFGGQQGAQSEGAKANNNPFGFIQGFLPQLMQIPQQAMAIPQQIMGSMGSMGGAGGANLFQGLPGQFSSMASQGQQAASGMAGQISSMASQGQQAASGMAGQFPSAASAMNPAVATAAQPVVAPATQTVAVPVVQPTAA